MRHLKLTVKRKLIIGAASICMAVLAGLLLVIIYLINTQNIQTSRNFLQQAFNLIVADLAGRQTNLLENTRQFAVTPGIDFKIKYLSDEKAKIDAAHLIGTYRELANQLATMTAAANAWKMAIYDREGDLLTFAVQTEAGSWRGYRQGFPTPVSTVAALAPHENLTETVWQRSDTLAEFDLTSRKILPDHETTQFEAIDDLLCIVSYAPIIGKVLNKEANTMEAKQVGVVMAIRPLDQAFMTRLTKLTDTKPHLFIGETLALGEFKDYQRLAAEVSQQLTKPKEPTAEPDILFNEITLQSVGYFQGILPLYAGQQCIGAIAVLYSQEIARTHTWQIIKGFSGVFAISMLVLMVAVTLFSNSFTRPLQELVTDVTTRIVHGDFSQEIVVRQRDEIGELAEAFRTMKSTLSAVLGEVKTLIRTVQDGNLDARGDAKAFQGSWEELIVSINQVLEAFVAPMTQIKQTLARLAQGDFMEILRTADYQGDFRTMMQQVEMMMTKLTAVVLKVKNSARDVAQRSGEMRTVAEQMAEGASQQAAATEEVSASMEQMAANIRQTANNAKLTEQIARKSADDARAGRAAVTQIIDAMEIVAERISVIQEIASQTNMLSLNATIEAAKAQDYGRGFTVVASSVRDLARQSRAAAEEMRTLVHSCVILSAQAGEVLERLVPNSERTAELVQEISGAAQEQAIGVEHVNQALQQLDIVTQHNAATSEEVSSTAETLTIQAEQLQHTMAFFTVPDVAPVTAGEEEKWERFLQRLTDAPEHAHQRLLTFFETALLPNDDAVTQFAPTESTIPPLQTHKPSEPQGSRHGAAIHLNSPNAAFDERDQEFERY